MLIFLYSYHQLARCLWNRFAEQMLYAYKVGQVYKGMLSTNRLVYIYIYYNVILIHFIICFFFPGQVQTTNAFDSSTIEINMLRIYEIDFASGIFEI